MLHAIRKIYLYDGLKKALNNDTKDEERHVSCDLYAPLSDSDNVLQSSKASEGNTNHERN